MATIIGFATQFYTLWDVQVQQHYSTINSQHYHTGTTYTNTYIKKIAKSLDKVQTLYPGVTIDESLRGLSRSFSTRIKIELPQTVFPYGQLEGALIMECTNVFQLKRLFENTDHYQHTARRRALARRRLIQLGELVKPDAKLNLSDKYINPTHLKYVIERKQREDASGYFFNEGDKVQLTLRKVHSTGYDSAYGFVSIVTYQDSEDRLFYYKGSNPPNIDDEMVDVKCTIKHSEYKEVKQTLIQRVKVLEKSFTINEMEEWLTINILDKENLTCLSDSEIKETFKKYYLNFQTS